MRYYAKWLPAMGSWAVFTDDDPRWGRGHRVAWASSPQDANRWNATSSVIHPNEVIDKSGTGCGVADTIKSIYEGGIDWRNQ